MRERYVERLLESALLAADMLFATYRITSHKSKGDDSTSLSLLRSLISEGGGGGGGPRSELLRSSSLEPAAALRRARVAAAVVAVAAVCSAYMNQIFWYL